MKRTFLLMLFLLNLGCAGLDDPYSYDQDPFGYIPPPAIPAPNRATPTFQPVNPQPGFQPVPAPAQTREPDF